MVRRKGVVAEPEIIAKSCPYCMEELSRMEYLQLRTRKVCKCGKCGKVIDKRYVVF